MSLPRRLFEDMRDIIFVWHRATCLPTKVDAICLCLIVFDDAFWSMQDHSREAGGLRQRKIVTAPWSHTHSISSIGQKRP
jgi:hypothetical protein